MKLLKYLIPFLIVGFSTKGAYAQRIGQETAFDRQLRSRDDQPVREFVESKENIDVKDKSKNLEISGDVRFEWRNIQEKGIALYHDESSGYQDGYGLQDIPEGKKFKETYRYLRGGDHVDSRGIPLSVNDFDVEFNLKIKYTFKDAWAKAHLQFDNPCGIRGRNDCFGEFAVFNKNGSEVLERIPRDNRFGVKGSGEGIAVNLKRAYIGYNIYADGAHRLDIEVGRQKLDDIFDSEVQFSGRFDGILLRFASSVEEVFDWYITAGGFVVDERVNQFAYVTEIGFLDIYETGIDLKYNFIDWQKHGNNRCFINNPIGTNFKNSQISLVYTFSQCFLGHEIPIELYTGFLVNHAAKKTVFTHRKKKNLAWYAGVYVGNVDKKGDWSFDIEYVAVQAQAVSEFDVGSIGRGNILDEDMVAILDEKFRHQDSSSGLPSSGIIGYFPRRGNANFVGVKCEFLYAITDNLSIDLSAQFSREEDRHIGGRHRYRDFEIEAIYAF
ncbi:MAG: hypothetical protein ACH350_05290 [Parachlamydiaceae bacterium]